jgi:hypothetical protein
LQGLQREAQPAKQSREVVRVIERSEFLLDQRGDPFERPAINREAGGERSLP